MIRPLPELPADQVGILVTVDAGAPHAIPVSALVRGGPRRLVFALAPGRASLDRLRRSPRAAMVLIGPGFALTARGTSRVVAERLAGAEFVTALELTIAAIDDALTPRTEIVAGIAWRRPDPDDAARDEQVRGALVGLAGEPALRDAERRSP